MKIEIENLKNKYESEINICQGLIKELKSLKPLDIKDNQ